MSEHTRRPAAGRRGGPARPCLSFEQAIRFAAELIRIPSLPGEEEAVAMRIVDELRALGFDEVRTDRAGNVIGRIIGRGDAPAVALSSHMDVVDVGDPANWEHHPYAGVVADGCLHGRGAMDLKGPLALQVYAAAQFVDDRPAGDLLTVFTVYEEKGCWGMMHPMETAEPRPGAVILGEATDGDLCTGHRGHAELAVEIHGLAAHASAPERGRNPNDVLPHVLLALQDISAWQPVHPVLGRATFTPTTIETWPKSGNVIPDRVRITLDLRVLPGWDEDEALAQIRGVLAERVAPADGITLEVIPGRATHRAWTGWVDEHSNFTPRFLLPDAHPVVQAAAEALRQATGHAPAIRRWMFGTDGGPCGTHGVPAIGFAPGIEALAHTSRERLDLEQAREAFDAYPALIRAVQGALAEARGIPVQGVAAAPVRACTERVAIMTQGTGRLKIETEDRRGAPAHHPTATGRPEPPQVPVGGGRDRPAGPGARLRRGAGVPASIVGRTRRAAVDAGAGTPVAAAARPGASRRREPPASCPGVFRQPIGRTAWGPWVYR